MTVELNGKELMVEGAKTLETLLVSLGVCLKGTAVEVNGEILTPEGIATTALHDHDKIEVIQFVGGG